MVSTRRRSLSQFSSTGRWINLPVINLSRLHYAQLRNAQFLELVNDLVPIRGLEMHGHDVHAVVSQLLQFFTKRRRSEVTRNFRELRHSIRKRRLNQQRVELLHF